MGGSFVLLHLSNINKFYTGYLMNTKLFLTTSFSLTSIT